MPDCPCATHRREADLLAEIERLRKQSREAAARRDNEWAHDKSTLAILRNLMDEAAASLAEPPGSTTGYSQMQVAAVASVLRERDDARKERDAARAEIERLRTEHAGCAGRLSHAMNLPGVNDARVRHRDVQLHEHRESYKGIQALLADVSKERDNALSALRRIKALGMGGGPFGLGHAWNIASEALDAGSGRTS